jgi:lipoprotein NlpD
MKCRRRCFYATTLLIALALTTGLLTACSSNNKYWDPTDYTVKSGDTLYSIAWRYELDIDDFAAWNNLGSSTFIKAGQRLHTRKPAGFDAANSSEADQSITYSPGTSSEQASAGRNASSQKMVKVKKGDNLYVLSRRYGVDMKRLVQLNQLKKPYILQPGQTIFLQPLNSSGSTTRSTSSTPKPAPDPAPQRQSSNKSWPSTVRWQRPATGRVVKQFSSRRNDAKGIDIAGKEGSAILAAADGTVVYSGNGLISYGNLIIIKHNKIFLSAYAYNSKLLVKEGDSVKAGQKIAEMGHKDKTGSKLHFEIRKNGKPVDPLKYLPW